VSDIPLNLARSNPALVIKLLRILENESSISSPLSPLILQETSKPSTLRLQAAQSFVVSVHKKVRTSLLDLNRKDPKALYQSMEVTEQLLKDLNGYVSKFVAPCFPPYYNVYEYVKNVYVEKVFEHFT
jgi:hypothetical protein